MTGELIVVFGGSGFIGRHVVKTLARRGYLVRVPMRRPHLGQDLRVLGDVGQIHLMQANLRYPESVDRALEGADGVVNLVAVLFERGKQAFKTLHVDGAEAVAQAAKRHHVERVVHISAIGADPNGRSRYAKTKAQGEAAVRAHVPGAVILRPSIVFGPGDAFFNRFAAMAKSSPFLPLIGGGKTRFQPVYVQDVAEAVLAGLTLPEARGRIYELGGPRVYTFRELLDFTLATIERKRPYLPLSFSVAGIIGAGASFVAGLIPMFDPVLTPDQVRLLKTHNVVGASGEPNIGAITDLGVSQIESIEAIVPSYLWPYRAHGQFQTRPQNS
jgi:NADH dehydrogenase